METNADCGYCPTERKPCIPQQDTCPPEEKEKKNCCKGAKGKGRKGDDAAIQGHFSSEVEVMEDFEPFEEGRQTKNTGDADMAETCKGWADEVSKGYCPQKQGPPLRRDMCCSPSCSTCRGPCAEPLRNGYPPIDEEKQESLRACRLRCACPDDPWCGIINEECKPKPTKPWWPCIRCRDPTIRRRDKCIPRPSCCQPPKVRSEHFPQHTRESVQLIHSIESPEASRPILPCDKVQPRRSYVCRPAPCPSPMMLMCRDSRGICLPYTEEEVTTRTKYYKERCPQYLQNVEYCRDGYAPQLIGEEEICTIRRQIQHQPCDPCNPCMFPCPPQFPCNPCAPPCGTPCGTPCPSPCPSPCPPCGPYYSPCPSPCPSVCASSCPSPCGTPCPSPCPSPYTQSAKSTKTSPGRPVTTVPAPMLPPALAPFPEVTDDSLYYPPHQVPAGFPTHPFKEHSLYKPSTYHEVHPISPSQQARLHETHYVSPPPWLPRPSGISQIPSRFVPVSSTPEQGYQPLSWSTPSTIPSVTPLPFTSVGSPAQWATSQPPQKKFSVYPATATQITQPTPTLDYTLYQAYAAGYPPVPTFAKAVPQATPTLRSSPAQFSQKTFTASPPPITSTPIAGKQAPPTWKTPQTRFSFPSQSALSPPITSSPIAANAPALDWKTPPSARPKTFTTLGSTIPTWSSDESSPVIKPRRPIGSKTYFTDTSAFSTPSQPFKSTVSQSARTQMPAQFTNMSIDSPYPIKNLLPQFDTQGLPATPGSARMDLRVASPTFNHTIAYGEDPGTPVQDLQQTWTLKSAPRTSPPARSTLSPYLKRTDVSPGQDLDISWGLTTPTQRSPEITGTPGLTRLERTDTGPRTSTPISTKSISPFLKQSTPPSGLSMFHETDASWKHETPPIQKTGTSRQFERMASFYPLIEEVDTSKLSQSSQRQSSSPGKISFTPLKPSRTQHALTPPRKVTFRPLTAETDTSALQKSFQRPSVPGQLTFNPLKPTLTPKEKQQTPAQTNLQAFTPQRAIPVTKQKPSPGFPAQPPTPFNRADFSLFKDIDKTLGMTPTPDANRRIQHFFEPQDKTTSAQRTFVTSTPKTAATPNASAFEKLAQARKQPISDRHSISHAATPGASTRLSPPTSSVHKAPEVFWNPPTPLGKTPIRRTPQNGRSPPPPPPRGTPAFKTPVASPRPITADTAPGHLQPHAQPMSPMDSATRFHGFRGQDYKTPLERRKAVQGAPVHRFIHDQAFSSLLKQLPSGLNFNSMNSLSSLTKLGE